MPNVTSFVFSDQDYKKAAKEYKKEFLQLPVLALAEILKYFTPIAGCRYKVGLPSISTAAGFSPYDPSRVSSNTHNVIFRELETYLGSVILDFEPNTVVQTLIGKMAAASGEGQKQAPSAKLVVATVMKALGASIGANLFKAKRNAAGTTTADLFDGFDTIIDAEITATNISAANGNLFTPGANISAVNACDLFKEFERSCSDELREQEKICYVEPKYADMYNDAYMATHAAQVYNKEFNQAYIEGSNNKTTIVPLACMSGTDKAIITPKSNMIIGFDNMSDVENISVDRFKPFVLTLSAAMFFGVQIYTIDKTMFNVMDLTAHVMDHTAQEET